MMRTASASAPLVSCLMPTHDRRPFVGRAIEYFLRQDYPNRELVILDDGSDPVEDLVPENPRVRYRRLPRRLSLGAKRNLACREARGEILAHWDDDDWHAPWRLRYQVAELRRRRVEICGLDALWFYDPVSDRAWHYVYQPRGRPWLAGGTFCYTRAFWERHPFAEIDVGEDNRFVRRAAPARAAALGHGNFYVAIVHDANTSPKRPRGRRWRPRPANEVREVLGEDREFYARLAGPAVAPAPAADRRTRPAPERRAAKRPAPAAAAAPAGAKRAAPAGAAPADETRPETGRQAIPAFTYARASDLDLVELRAFNDGASHARMRRWELPFALFQARLQSLASVLDCTINPDGLGERLRALYPHVTYHSWNPVRGGRLELPFGFPDRAYDRVFCVNTLEHLPLDQRREVVAELARKLAPGGLLVTTCDHYFESFWENEEILRLGVLRADRQEVFNGWNRVTPDELAALCEPHGLEPLGPVPSPPREGDPGLYLNTAPAAHASFGAVFAKAPGPRLPAAKKIVLALLTWNTRDVSLDSIEAYAREARMLRRLGQEPYLVVCDNGSTDGTPEALRELDERLDLPHRFLFNERNVGSSIARNQIIDAMLEAGGDYLLMMDGDIEIVPFSSFAMLRHMEDRGRLLGCLGANSAEHTRLRRRAASSLYSLSGHRLEETDLVAWTQYGMFRREVFEAGVRFDENEPFDRPGWGFEDNDLAFQMAVRGFKNFRFYGMVYLHRDINSSIPSIRALGIDPDRACRQRKEYVIRKWAEVDRIRQGPLKLVRRVTARFR